MKSATDLFKHADPDIVMSNRNIRRRFLSKDLELILNAVTIMDLVQQILIDGVGWMKSLPMSYRLMNHRNDRSCTYLRRFGYTLNHNILADRKCTIILDLISGVVERGMGSHVILSATSGRLDVPVSGQATEYVR